MNIKDFDFDLGVPRDQSMSVLFHLLLQDLSYNRVATRAIAKRLFESDVDVEKFLDAIEEDSRQNYLETRAQILTWFK